VRTPHSAIRAAERRRFRGRPRPERLSARGDWVDGPPACSCTSRSRGRRESSHFEFTEGRTYLCLVQHDGRAVAGNRRARALHSEPARRHRSDSLPHDWRRARTSGRAVEKHTGGAAQPVSGRRHASRLAHRCSFARRGQPESRLRPEANTSPREHGPLTNNADQQRKARGLWRRHRRSERLPCLSPQAVGSRRVRRQSAESTRASPVLTTSRNQRRMFHVKPSTPSSQPTRAHPAPFGECWSSLQLRAGMTPSIAAAVVQHRERPPVDVLAADASQRHPHGPDGGGRPGPSFPQAEDIRSAT
jgi:hypothetical protein